MLALLYNVPVSKRDWDVWSKSHQDSHTKIVQALFNKRGISVPLYQFDPMNFRDFETFLNRNQQAHNDMLGSLRIAGTDLSGIDYKDKNQLTAWVALHSQDHRNAEIALGI